MDKPAMLPNGLMPNGWTDAMLAPLTRREAVRLRDMLRSAQHSMTSSYTFPQEPSGWFSELAWLARDAERQAQHRSLSEH